MGKLALVCALCHTSPHMFYSESGKSSREMVDRHRRSNKKLDIGVVARSMVDVGSEMSWDFSDFATTNRSLACTEQVPLDGSFIECSNGHFAKVECRIKLLIGVPGTTKSIL